MVIYAGLKSDFADSVQKDTIADQIEAKAANEVFIQKV